MATLVCYGTHALLLHRTTTTRAASVRMMAVMKLYHFPLAQFSLRLFYSWSCVVLGAWFSQLLRSPPLSGGARPACALEQRYDV